MTPYYENKDAGIMLYCGDALEVIPRIPEGSIDALITDPPYSSGGQFRGDRTNSTVAKYVLSGQVEMRAGQQFTGDNRDQRAFLAWCSLWLCAARHAASEGAVACVFTDWRQLPTMTDAIQCGGWVWRNIATWWKPGVRMQRGRFSSSSEFVIYATNGPHSSDGENSPQNVMSCQTANSEEKEHIAEKPMQIMEWLIGATRPASLVLDPFMGSGTTAIACIRTGRRFIGCEISEAYCEIAVSRIKRELAQPRLFAPVATVGPLATQFLLFGEDA